MTSSLGTIRKLFASSLWVQAFGSPWLVSGVLLLAHLLAMAAYRKVSYRRRLHTSTNVQLMPVFAENTGINCTFVERLGECGPCGLRLRLIAGRLVRPGQFGRPPDGLANVVAEGRNQQ